MRKLFFVFSFLLPIYLFIFHQYVFATEKNLPVITIVNPIRGNELGHEKEDLLPGLKTQWQFTKDAKVNATWLWQYSALENEGLVNFAKYQMKNQEFGIFLEVDRNFANKSSVQYRGQGPWYFSDGLFLVSYDQAERRKLLDEVFTKFKKTFGVYPKTVGAWWIGADSLNYLQEKYGITAAFKASEQFNLDVYSIWGSPWSIPYIASKENEGIPASSFDVSSKVVILQWAARDPTKGYTDFAYSIQDFTLRESDFSYVNYITSVFLQKPLDNMLIGLENSGTSLPLEVYYKKIVEKARELADAKKVRIVLAKDYAQEFLSQKKIFATDDARYFLSKDYQSEDQSFWYNGTNFRAGILKSGENIYLIDLRDYSYKASEDFSFLPNSQGYLRITTPTSIDSMRFPEKKILITKSKEAIIRKEKNDTVTLFSGNKKIAYFTPLSVELFLNNQTSQIFNFKNKAIYINVFSILLGIFLLYSLVIFLHKQNFRAALLQLCLLLIPLFLAYPFLSNGDLHRLAFVFDRKELFLLAIFPLLNNFSITQNLLLFQVVPFFLLLVAHYLFTILLSRKKYKLIYYFALSCIIIVFAHTIYFPLDRSTYGLLSLVFGFLFIIFVVISFFVFKKTKSKKLLIQCVMMIPLVLVLSAWVIYFSRTKIVLTPFEVSAITIIKDRQKDVLFVSETDYNIKPIYKAVKPLLYENYQFGGKLTNTHWEIVERPENNMLNVTNYDDKLIVVPRYLGADISVKEMEHLKLKKIFDNAQIAIFEKDNGNEK